MSQAKLEQRLQNLIDHYRADGANIHKRDAFQQALDIVREELS